jgi:hypothetical protein
VERASKALELQQIHRNKGGKTHVKKTTKITRIFKNSNKTRNKPTKQQRLHRRRRSKPSSATLLACEDHAPIVVPRRPENTVGDLERRQ